jgi:cytosolic 5'-nucleotidase 3
LKKEELFYPNIHIITNIFEFDANGNAIKISTPHIHSLNKDEAAVRNYPFYEKLKNRKNVILLGDSIGDIEMTNGIMPSNVLKIGFLNEKVDDKTKLAYENSYDVLITEDKDMNFINEFLEDIK